MKEDFRLTTFDNPFDPFDEFSQWYLYDCQKGYNTCAYIDRISNVYDDMTDKEYNEEHERVINSILENDFLNIYKKVSRKGTAAD